MPANGPVTPQFAPEVPDISVTAMKLAHVTQPDDRHVTTKPSTRDMPFLSDGDMLLVANDDSRDLLFSWGGKRYPVPAHDQGWVIFEALVNQLGDPWSMENNIVRFSDANGNKGIVMDRQAELTRLFAMYAVKSENLNELVEKAPKVRVTTTHGQRVMFPCELPDMLAMPVELIDEHKVNTDVTRMFDSLSSENEELREKVARMEEFMNEQIKAREGVEAGV